MSVRIPATILMPFFNHISTTVESVNALFSNFDLPEELVLIDDGSTASLESRAKEIVIPADVTVKLVRLPHNGGFIEAVNTGFTYAKHPYIVLLNNDTIPLPGWLNALYEIMEKFPDAGAVGSKLLTKEYRVEEAGGEILYHGEAIQLGAGLNRLDPSVNFLRKVTYCSGASLMIRRTALGGTAEFLLESAYGRGYYEDTDLCELLRSKGYNVYYQPRSEVVHLGSQTFGRGIEHDLLIRQNRMKFCERWMDRLSRRLIETTLDPVDNFIFIDQTFPWQDRAAGGKRMWNILSLARSIMPAARIIFIAMYGVGQEHYQKALEDIGIECHSGNNDLRSIPWPHILQSSNRNTAWIAAPDLYHWTAPIVRALSIRSRIIYDTVDIHSKRLTQGRQYGFGDELSQKRTAWRELDACQDADIVVAVSEVDGAWTREQHAKIVEVVPIIHELRESRTPWEDRSGVLFVGNFNHTPNVDAMNFFLLEIWPLIQLSLPGIHLSIAGNNPTERIRDLESDTISVLGYVPDLTNLYERTRLTVMPLRFGSGIKGKLGETLEYQVPFVATTTAIEGMPVAEAGIIVADNDARAFADAVIRLYEDKPLWSAFQNHAQNIIKNHYHPDLVREKLSAILPLPATQPKTTIIILCWNNLEYTKQAIASIQTSTWLDYILVPVDNGSTDGTPEYLRNLAEIHAWIKPVFLKYNTGFAGGINAGLATVTTEFIAILNNDVVMTSGWMERMLVHFYQFPSLGLIGPMACNVSGVQNIPFSSSLDALDPFARMIFAKNAGTVMATQRIVGFAWVMRQEVLHTVGGLHLDFGKGNYEDDDYCIRVLNAGYQIGVARDVFIYHKGSASWNSQEWQHSMKQNLEVLHRRWGQVWTSDGRWIERPPQAYRRNRDYFPPVSKWEDMQPWLRDAMEAAQDAEVADFALQSFKHTGNQAFLLYAALSTLRLPLPEQALRIILAAPKDHTEIEALKLWISVLALYSLERLEDMRHTVQLARDSGYAIPEPPESAIEWDLQWRELQAQCETAFSESKSIGND